VEQPASVRIATTTDVTALYEQLVLDLEADNSLGLPVDRVDVARTVGKICRGENGIAGIIDGEYGIAASIGIQAVKPWFTSEWMLSQVWLFVNPDERASDFADELFQFAAWHREDMANRVGYDIVLENTVLSLNRLPAKLRLWGRYGQQIGGTFWTRR
jgi:hypothetical protein